MCIHAGCTVDSIDLSQIAVLRFLHDEFHGITGFITDRADYVFSLFLCHVVDTDNAGIFFVIENGRLGPSDVVGYTVLQKSAFNQLLTIRVRYLAEFNFVVYFDGCV